MKKSVALAIGLVLMVAALVAVPPVASAKQDNIKLKTFVHYPAPHRKQVSLGCTATVDDQVADYGLTGWHMPTAGMIYKINSSSKPKNITNTQLNQAINASFNAWTAADAKQIFTYGGETRDTAARYNGTNALFWKRIPGSAIAITYTWYYTATGDVAESDTAFNARYAWAVNSPSGDCAGTVGKYDLQNIATHEFGHWVGLDDLYADADKDLTMFGYGTTGELKKDSLGLGDITGTLTVAP